MIQPENELPTITDPYATKATTHGGKKRNKRKAKEARRSRRTNRK